MVETHRSRLDAFLVLLRDILLLLMKRTKYKLEKSIGIEWVSVNISSSESAALKNLQNGSFTVCELSCRSMLLLEGFIVRCAHICSKLTAILKVPCSLG